ncbi:O-antigen ligase family protein [Hyphomicrobium sp. CS1GBMeth3]|uniref:O-antigen ligase family protein n=1 Tax=Hyphomicrobium sp. CS1GBMeth3 TaxID=1892845 RepID=UPI001558C7D9|nr:O-antigen ligase family protein [Hyphomicrobium sp. CS1GBMeth3]
MTDDSAGRLPAKPLNADIALVGQAVWVLFFFAISMAAWQYTSSDAERYAWLLADFICAFLFFRYQSQFINLALANLVFMSWPVFAMVSAAWSVAPGASFYFGIQLLMTVLVAFLLCIQFRLEQLVVVVFFGMFLAALLAVAAALLPPARGIDFVGNWRGGFPTKNVMGDAMVLLVISASCLFLQGRWRLLTASAAVLGLVLIVLTRSATPMLSVMLTLSPLPFAYALIRSRTVFSLLVGLSLILVAVVGTGTYVAVTYFGADPIGALLASFGKERSLTGRTLLWDMAQQAMDAKPWLGFGFNAYWVDPPAGMLQIRDAFGQKITFFHNNFLEAAVAFGVIGPVLLIMGIFVAAVRSIRRLLHATDPIEIWPLLITIQVIIQCPVQNPLLANHSLWQVMFVAAAIVRR